MTRGRWGASSRLELQLHLVLLLLPALLLVVVPRYVDLLLCKEG